MLNLWRFKCTVNQLRHVMFQNKMNKNRRFKCFTARYEHHPCDHDSLLYEFSIPSTVFSGVLLIPLLDYLWPLWFNTRVRELVSEYIHEISGTLQLFCASIVYLHFCLLHCNWCSIQSAQHFEMQQLPLRLPGAGEVINAIIAV